MCRIISDTLSRKDESFIKKHAQNGLSLLVRRPKFYSRRSSQFLVNPKHFSGVTISDTFRIIEVKIQFDTMSIF